MGPIHWKESTGCRFTGLGCRAASPSKIYVLLDKCLWGLRFGVDVAIVYSIPRAYWLLVFHRNCWPMRLVSFLGIGLPMSASISKHSHFLTALELRMASLSNWNPPRRYLIKDIYLFLDIDICDGILCFPQAILLI